MKTCSSFTAMESMLSNQRLDQPLFLVLVDTAPKTNNWGPFGCLYSGVVLDIGILVARISEFQVFGCVRY
jgi:hypothetical protein